MKLFAGTVVSRSSLTVTTTENTAAMPAILRLDSEKRQNSSCCVVLRTSMSTFYWTSDVLY